MNLDPRQQYLDTLTAIALSIRLRIIPFLWAGPGEGKTSLIESAKRHGYHVETVILSHSEPSDVVGMPVVTGGRIRFAEAPWARRVIESKQPSIVLFDDYPTARVDVQNATHHVLTHHKAGDVDLPEDCALVATGNPAHVVAGVYELEQATASRICHIDYDLPLEVFCDGLVTGDWPPLPIPEIPVDYEKYLAKWTALGAGFVRARPSQYKRVPEDTSFASRAFPVPRTWEYATRLVALAEAIGAPDRVREILVSGCVGKVAGHEFLAFARHQDLPDPEDALANGFDFDGLRPDRVYVILQSLLRVVQHNVTPERWTAAMALCAQAAQQTRVDAAVPAVRRLVDIRPGKAEVPVQVGVFREVLALAGLM
jgi:hypothetical protein